MASPEQNFVDHNEQYEDGCRATDQSEEAEGPPQWEMEGEQELSPEDKEARLKQLLMAKALLEKDICQMAGVDDLSTINPDQDRLARRDQPRQKSKKPKEKEAKYLAKL